MASNGDRNVNRAAAGLTWHPPKQAPIPEWIAGSGQAMAGEADAPVR
jgi:hypothetical protein